MNIVLCEPASLRVQGDQVHRTRAPAAALAKRGHHVLTGSYLMPRVQQALEWTDAAVLIQCVDVDFVPLLERRRRRGLTTLLELNDDFTEPCAFGEVGRFYHQPRVRALLLELAGCADGLWTSTPELARRFGKYGANLSVLPNAAPEKVARKQPSTNERLGVPRLGWAGSAGHAHDWPRFVPALVALLCARPEQRFWVMAPAELRDVFRSLPQEQLVWETPREFSDYMQFLATLDVGLAPLGDSAFARGRSDVKWLEYTQAGVAAALSRGPAYEAAEHQKTALVAESPDALMAEAARLLDDALLRAQLVANAQAWVAEQRTPEALARQREASILASGPPAARRNPECWPAKPDALAPLEHVGFTASERQLVAGLKVQDRAAAAYPHFVAAARLAPENYLPELYAAKSAPTPAEAHRHRRRALKRAPESLAAHLLGLESLASVGERAAARREACALLLGLGPTTLVWQQLALSLDADGHLAGAVMAWRQVVRGWPTCPTSAAALAYALLAWLEQHHAHKLDQATALTKAVDSELAEALGLAESGAALGVWELRLLRARAAIIAGNSRAAVGLLAPALRAREVKEPAFEAALALLAREALALGNTRAAAAAFQRLQLDVRSDAHTVS